MELISQFIKQYRKEYDFYEQVCRMTAQILDSNLQAAGIRAIVTSRAKNPIRLEAKILQRKQSKGYDYGTVDQIYEDIVDLAGVRVALYFPAENEEVGRIIASLFNFVAEPKKFPTETKLSYKKRFSGYWATHYRVQLPEKLVNESQKRYCEARVEIQVASVLMHAWSEVEHDLVYKPLQGELSSEEHVILDELNGLVLAGELALERLQRAGEARVSSKDREFSNHYDLASALLEMSRTKLAGVNNHDSAIGRVDLLFKLISELGLNKPEDLSRYVEALHSDFEKRPLAEQVIDQVLAEDTKRYEIYNKIRVMDVPAPMSKLIDSPQTSQKEAILTFMSNWIEYEHALQTVAPNMEYKTKGMISSKFLMSVLEMPKELVDTASRLRQFRNMLVHGIEVPDAEYIKVQITDLQKLLNFVKGRLNHQQN